MKFPFRKKKSDPPADPLPEKVPISLFLTENEQPKAELLLSALPPQSEVFIASPLRLNAAQFPALRFLSDFEKPSGEKIVFLPYAELDDALPESFFPTLFASTESLLLLKGCSRKNAATMRKPFDFASCKDLDSICGCVLQRELYNRTHAGLQNADLFLSAVFAPLLFCEDAVILCFNGISFQKNAEQLLPADKFFSCLAFFNANKTKLSPDRYRFAFQLLVKLAVSAYASLALQTRSKQLQNLDETLKKENLALSVAVGDKAPLNFVRRLRKHGYTLPLPVKFALSLLFPAQKAD